MSKLVREEDYLKVLENCHSVNQDPIFSPLERKRADTILRIQKELVEALRALKEAERGVTVAYNLIIQHHAIGPRVQWGALCPHCHHEDGTETELNLVAAVRQNLQAYK